MRDRRRSPRGRGAKGHRRRPRGRGATDPRRTRTDRTVQGRTAPDPAAPKVRRRTRRNPPDPTGRRDHPGVQGQGRQDPDHRRGRRGPRDRRGRPVRRSRRSRPVLRARPDPARRRTAGPTGSARRDGSPARGGSSGSRTRHRRRRRTAEAAAGSGAQGYRRGRGRGRPDPVRAPEAAVRPGCTWSPCWSGSSTGTPRRRARRPRGACGTAGRVPARRRGAVVHRDRQVLQDPQVLLDPQALRGRPEAGEGSRAAGIRNRRPGAAVVAAGVRHRPYGDRRPRTSRRNPTGVRSGRSACRRFPLSFPASRPVPVAATGRCGRVPTGSPVGEPGSCAAVFPGVSSSVSSYFFTRTVFVDRVSRVISSASVTFAFSRTVPVAASTTSTTFASSFAVSAFPEALAS